MKLEPVEPTGESREVNQIEKERIKLVHAMALLSASSTTNHLHQTPYICQQDNNMAKQTVVDLRVLFYNMKLMDNQITMRKKEGMRLSFNIY